MRRLVLIQVALVACAPLKSEEPGSIQVSPDWEAMETDTDTDTVTNTGALPCEADMPTPVPVECVPDSLSCGETRASSTCAGTDQAWLCFTPRARAARAPSGWSGGNIPVAATPPSAWTRLAGSWA